MLIFDMRNMRTDEGRKGDFCKSVLTNLMSFKFLLSESVPPILLILLIPSKFSP
jgi:hypothetical protein